MLQVSEPWGVTSRRKLQVFELWDDDVFWILEPPHPTTRRNTQRVHNDRRLVGVGEKHAYVQYTRAFIYLVHRGSTCVDSLINAQSAVVSLYMNETLNETEWNYDETYTK